MADFFRGLRWEIVIEHESIAGVGRQIRRMRFRLKAGKFATGIPGSGVTASRPAEEDVRERRSARLAITAGVALKICGQISVRWRRLERRILKEKLHLLHQPAADDGIVFVESGGERLPVKQLIASFRRLGGYGARPIQRGPGHENQSPREQEPGEALARDTAPHTAQRQNAHVRSRTSPRAALLWTAAGT